MAKPATVEALAALVAAATAPFELVGTGTKRGLGRPVEAQKLDLSGFSKVIAYEPDELILECGAAARLADVQKLLAKKGQMLPFEPPDFSGLLGTKHGGTLGGALMCNLAGPRRMKAGAARDYILGVSGVNGKGEIIKAGARVVKNVTGYDLPRLLAGSHGTLMAVTSVIFKVLPAPESEITLRFTCKDLAEAVARMAQALQTSAEVSSAAFLPPDQFYLRLEGIAPSVDFRRGLLVEALGKPAAVLAQKQSAKLWADVGAAAPLRADDGDDIWRVSVPPSEAPAFVAAVKPKAYLCDWAGGLIWLAARPGATIRQHLRSGHAQLFRARAETRAGADVFQPQPPALAALSARVKHAFDPKGLFNPGRMYKGV